MTLIFSVMFGLWATMLANLNLESESVSKVFGKKIDHCCCRRCAAPCNW